MTRYYLYIFFILLIYSISIPISGGRQSLRNTDESIVAASFFPTSSPFSNSQNITRLNRKKLSRKLESVNLENYRLFLKKNESLIMMAKKVQTQSDRHGLLLYWQLGEQISLEKNLHQENSSYPPFLVDRLSVELGIDTVRLSKIEMFYTSYSTAASLSLELTWEHYEYLIDITDKTQRQFYQRLAVEKKWSPQDLKEKINQHLYEKKSSSLP